MKLKRIQPKQDLSDCSGCGACMVVCPQKAITMDENYYGCRYPVVDEALCVNCGKCVRACGFCTALPAQDTIEAYAAFGCNEDLVRKSASGGIFASLAEAVISEGGLAAGAVLECTDSDMDVFHVLTDRTADIPGLQGSKYVQSDAARSYEQVKCGLEQGKRVLFSGTPCQVAAIKALTGDPENLITVDIVCHGVPTKRMLNEYGKILGKYLHGTVTGIRFRDKSAAKAYTARIETEKNGRRHAYSIRSSFLSFYALFLNGSICRESCHHCPYAGTARVSDITIGDYWGIETHHGQQMQTGEMPDRKDWSCVLVNTEKGRTFLTEHKEALTLYSTEASWVREQNRQLNEPAKKSENREQFLLTYAKGGYRAVEKAFVRKNGGIFRFYRRMKKNLRKMVG